MSCRRYVGESAAVNVYDLIGEDGEEAGFISHLGLARTGGAQPTRSVEVYHMGPPLTVDGQMDGDVIGGLKLTDDEVSRIRTFIDRHSNEHAAVRMVGPESVYSVYIIRPHVALRREPDGRYSRTRFSCAGFAFEAYREARILLVDVTSLPLVELEVVKAAYPQFAVLLDRPQFRQALGLVGGGGWPILFCGYLFHSVRRADEDVRATPHRPSVDQRVFE
jgi:hypothetical protein